MNKEKNSKTKYNLGDKVIARWVDGKRYPGQIHQVLTLDSYLILFEDGLQRVVKVNHIEPNLNPVPKTELPFDDPRLQRAIHESDICDLILNCSCGSIVDNGFLVQCEHCLTWQHADCLEVETDADLFEAITCSSCLNPKGVRESCRYKFDHSWLKDATLPNLMTTKDGQIQANDRIAAVNFLLEDALECVAVLHGLRAKIPLKNKKTDNCKELKCWSKSWLTTNFGNLSKKQDSTPSTVKVNTPSKGKSKIYKKQRLSKKKLSKSSVDLDNTDPCSSSNADDSNLPLINTNQVTSDKNELKEIKSMDMNKSLSPRDSLSASSDNLDQVCQKNLDEHIKNIQNQLEMRLKYIESRINELEEWYGPNLNPDDIEANRKEFRIALKNLHSDLETFKKLQFLIKKLKSNTLIRN